MQQNSKPEQENSQAQSNVTGLVVQSNEAGDQQLPAQPRLSWLYSLCSCFVPSDTGMPISLVNDGELLPPQGEQLEGRKTLVIDLDETLVHSLFSPDQKADLVVKVNWSGAEYKVYVRVRPGAVEFVQQMSLIYEIVIFTASLSMYANPVLKALIDEKYIHHKLFREHCVVSNGGYVKDLSRLGRDMNQVMIIDNSPQSFRLQPQNGIHILSWFENQQDNELAKLAPMLEYLSELDNVVEALDYSKDRFLKSEAMGVPPLQSPKDQDNLIQQDKPDLKDRQNFNSPMHKPTESFIFKNDSDRIEEVEEEEENR